MIPTLCYIWQYHLPKWDNWFYNTWRIIQCNFKNGIWQEMGWCIFWWRCTCQNGIREEILWCIFWWRFSFQILIWQDMWLCIFWCWCTCRKCIWKVMWWCILWWQCNLRNWIWWEMDWWLCLFLCSHSSFILMIKASVVPHNKWRCILKGLYQNHLLVPYLPWW